MSILIAKIIINYLLVSLMFLLLYTYGPLDLIVPKAYEKYKDALIILFCIFWPTQIPIFINTIKSMKKGE